ncbi:MAG: SGNH/GDSL hydrolase family protein [Clostridia bacterium]|nr:SGNH/GDSL hydrolase family protein [Clostridia bacterium]
MKRILCFLSVILAAVLAVTGCGTGNVTEESTAADSTSAVSDKAPETVPETEMVTTEEDTQAIPEPLTFDWKNSDTIYVVSSRTAGTSTQLSNIVTAFLTRLGGLSGVKYKAVTDAAAPTGDPEIIIGHGSREGSEELFKELAPSDWTLSVIGNRIYAVGGTPDATAQALYHLLSNYVNKGVTVYTEGVLSVYISGEKMPDIPDSGNQSFEILRGLTVYAIGDSYFAGEGLNPSKDVWPALMAAKYSQTFVNYGKGGSTVSNYITTNSPMCERIASMKDGNPDLVLFEGGANDWNHRIPIGNAGTNDTKTFRGAVASCIEQLHAKYPGALIVCITNWDYGQKNGSGIDSTEYAKAMIETAEKYPYTVTVSASDTSVIPAYMSMAIFRAEYSISASDRSHLNIEGHKLVFPWFERLIAQGFESFKK